MSSALLIGAGLAGLLLGAALLVRGGAALASHLGVRPIVAGLTVVALGTSRPELVVGLNALDGRLSGVDGAILCLGGVAYTAGVVRTSRREPAPVQADYASRSERAAVRGRRELARRALALVAGIGLVLLGAELLVDGAIVVARSRDVSEATIGSR